MRACLVLLFFVEQGVLLFAFCSFRNTVGFEWFAALER